VEDTKSSKPPVALFLGSGFSSEFGLPATRELNNRLLGPIEETLSAVPGLEEFISATISEFWERVFRWRTGLPPPSFEDHFTQIDLAANSGHHLGSTYSPKKLRALRRMTIYRVFSLLACDQAQYRTFDDLLQRVNRTFSPTFITTNWDTQLEWFLDWHRAPYNPGIDVMTISGNRSNMSPEYRSSSCTAPSI
jgi:hypothetical protein